METVKVSKADLISLLTTNKAAEETAYADAVSSFRTDAIAELDTALKDAQAGKSISPTLTFTPPFSRTEVFAELIEQATACKDDIIQIAIKIC